ncbi:hydrogenase maturation nickel metallochaperone HypA [Streptomyces sp. FXJ1.172]|uniref:hydrogenase maturation nickel metallochaperone HypA/HybF n=1 Tax=Streptomyces sp. FXJ1.172 TaxID=710705 RepID=UPI0007D007DC|nr:hydrogenase maturation nickel metallochaperone HypA [Streptomyces sp. FXJ1.172]WEO93515.1 hydrogenase maturation nickel metallochaperone HypA [Streptomyces sp. FXJ1.172]
MHELSLATAVVDEVNPLAGTDVVRSVTLRIGELAAVVPEALEFAFALAAEGTALAGAELLIDTVEGRARCDGCGREGPTGMPPVLWCDNCAQPLVLLSGRELEIVRLVTGPGPAAPAAPAASDKEHSPTRR